MREIYFDNSATTVCSEGVINIVTEVMRKAYGNPSSMHNKGVEAENFCKTASEQLATELKVSPKEILFTSGGTESNNLAIKGVVYAYRRTGNHIITSKVEHPSVLTVVAELEKEGFDVTYLTVDKTGKIDLEEYEKALRPDTILTTVMMVNNEIGTRQPIEEMTVIKKRLCPNSFFHTDAVQGFGKYIVHPTKMGVNLVSISGHKFHGPKGIGALYIKNGVRIIPQMLGGGQQNDLRSGTHPVPGIAGLGVAAKEAYENFHEKIQYLYSLKKHLRTELLKIEGVNLLGPEEDEGAPHIVSAAFSPVRSEVLLHSLEAKGIYVSSGSACSTNKPGHSNTVKAIGTDSKDADSVIRFSLSNLNTIDEIDYCIDVLKDILPKLKKYSRK